MLAECQGGSGEGGGAMARVPGSWGHYRMLHTTQITTLSSLSTHPLVFDLMIFAYFVKIICISKLIMHDLFLIIYN